MLIDVLLHSPQQAHQVLADVWRRIKGDLLQGRRFSLRVEDETRSIQQNAKLHALCAEIAQQREWCGKRWDTETWKRLLTAAWLRAQGETQEYVPALDGKGFDVVYAQTSKLSIAKMAELIDWCEAWAAQHDVEVTR